MNETKSYILLVRVDFDALENRDPEVFSNVGLFTSDEEMKKYLSQFMFQTQGWNGKYYPRFEVQNLEVIS